MLVSINGALRMVPGFKDNSCSTRVLIIAAVSLFILQMVTALICTQVMAARWSELIASWPYEITFCAIIFIAIVLVKICQLYLNLKSLNSHGKENYSWITLVLTFPCALLLAACLFSCLLSGMRQYAEELEHLRLENNKNNVESYATTMNALKDSKYSNINQIISMMGYDQNGSNKLAWDTVQAKYECCGSSSPDDWLTIRSFLPSSCCYTEYELCTVRNSYGKGCNNKLTAIIKEQIQFLEITIYLLIMFEVIMFIIMAIAYFKIKRQHTKTAKTLENLKLNSRQMFSTIDGNHI